MVSVTSSSLGAARRSDLGGAGRFSLAGQPLFIALVSPGAKAFRAAVVSVVRSLFLVRQDEAVDDYFADFAKATPIVSVVFSVVRFHGSQTSHGDDFCFTQKTKRSTGVRTL